MLRGINRRYNKKRYRGLIGQVELISRLLLTRRKETFFLRHLVGTSLSLSSLNPPTHNRRKSDPPRARYIKTVITGMRSFIALRRQKRQGPRANRKLGVALGILELADKRAVRSSRAPLSPVRFPRPFLQLPPPSLRVGPRSRERFTRTWTISGVSLLSCSSSASPPPRPSRLRCTLSLIAGIYQTSK